MNWEQFAAKAMSISKVGLKYSTDPYALENYKELEELTIQMINEVAMTPVTKTIYERDIYPTPNVSVRVLLFNEEGKLLMVKEKDDGGWAVSGGWCDVFYSPQENAKKEVLEETGLIVEINRLLAVYQREKYKDYPTIVSEYVHYFSGTILDGTMHENHEVSEVAFFSVEELPSLSRKTTILELTRALDVYYGRKEVQFD